MSASSSNLTEPRSPTSVTWRARCAPCQLSSIALRVPPACSSIRSTTSSGPSPWSRRSCAATAVTSGPSSANSTESGCGPRFQSTSPSTPAGSVFRQVAEVRSTVPMRPSASSAESTPIAGWWRYTWPTISVRPRSVARVASAVASAVDVVIGFSTNTSLPARSAARASSMCVGPGVAITTASMRGSARTPAGSVSATPGGAASTALRAPIAASSRPSHRSAARARRVPQRP